MPSILLRHLERRIWLSTWWCHLFRPALDSCGQSSHFTCCCLPRLCTSV